MMNKIKLASFPIGVYLIAGFYIFGAAFLMVFYFINPEQAASAVAEYHGLPGSTGSWILPVTAGIGLVIASGLLSRSRWGFFLTLLYLLYFGVVNLILPGATRPVVSCGNAFWSIPVIGYLILVRKQFFGMGKAEPIQP